MGFYFALVTVLPIIFIARRYFRSAEVSLVGDLARHSGDIKVIMTNVILIRSILLLALFWFALSMTKDDKVVIALAFVYLIIIIVTVVRVPKMITDDYIKKELPPESSRLFKISYRYYSLAAHGILMLMVFLPLIWD